ncbi:recombinase family protein [Niallia sp. 03133]|uniref:recombinase family protein n=1 Tax=Niallia sp. 03133 TaxID=3458060 RepID=UPI0040444EE8
MDAYIYLRKSRKDLEEERKQAEQGNEYDTLDRHRSQLLELAKIKQLHVRGIYEEVVSGEYISERPQMQKMLREIENGMVDAVLCMDLDRLGRGDMVDQGTLYRILKNSETIIVTPSEVIDPQDENQELTFSIKSLIAREELKSIVKRMQRGRRQSAKEGKSISRKPPYGYTRDDNLKLHPDQETNWVVEMIFNKVIEGHGRRVIAEELDRMHIKPPEKDSWDPSTISSIIHNEVYTGKIIWGKLKYKKVNGKYIRKKMPPEQWQIHENAHEAIIPVEIFEQANEAMKGRWKPHVVNNKKLTNPLAGILFCEICGKSMVLQPRKNRPDDAIRCLNHQCKGVQMGCGFSLVEQRLLIALEEIVKQLEIPTKQLQPNKKNDIKLKEKILLELQKEKETIQLQNNQIHDFLEQKVYDIKTFLERQQIIKDKINTMDTKIQEVENDLIKYKNSLHNQNTFIPKLKSVIQSYYLTDNVEKKNRLLKSIIKKATFLRKKDWKERDQFELKVHLKI